MEYQELGPKSPLRAIAAFLGRLVPESGALYPDTGSGPAPRYPETTAWLTFQRAVAGMGEAIRARAGGRDLDLVSFGGEEGVLLCALAGALGARCILQKASGDCAENIGRPRGALFSPFRIADVFFSDAWLSTGIYRREEIPRGACLTGPAIVCAPGMSLVVDPGWEAAAEENGDLLLTRYNETR